MDLLAVRKKHNLDCRAKVLVRKAAGEVAGWMTGLGARRVLCLVERGAGAVSSARGGMVLGRPRGL